MKYGMFWGFMALCLIFSVLSCQSRNIKNVKGGNDSSMAANTIDGYAKLHGISRAEAAKRMRDDLVPPSDSHIEKVSANTKNEAPGTNQ